MKSGILIKFLAILLTALSLVAAVGGCAGIVITERAGLYVNGLEALQDQQYEAIARSLAKDYADRYTAMNMGVCPEALLDRLYGNTPNRYEKELWSLELYQEEKLLESAGNLERGGAKIRLTVSCEYPIAIAYDSYFPGLDDSDEIQETEPTATESTATEPQEEIVPGGWIRDSLVTVWEEGQLKLYHLYYYDGPTYTATVRLSEEMLQISQLHLLTLLYPYRYTFISMLVWGLILFVAGFVFLLWSAGRIPGGEIRPGGLCRLPLDLCILVAGALTGVLIWLHSRLWEWTQQQGPHPGNVSLLGTNLLVIILIVLGTIFTLAAQIKVKNRFWWKNSLLGRCFKGVRTGVRFLSRSVSAGYRLLPLMWQWLLVGALMGLTTWITFLAATGDTQYRFNGLLLFLLALEILGCIAVICYSSYCFGLLIGGARKMAEGSLHHKIPTKHLRGSFLEFAQELNSLSQTAVEAAQKQMRSERMKSELITNVSHDIKTPLTSIINFVDLLKKPHTPQEEAQYLEVLSRQSGQMKQLIEDLMDLSKASTGNMPVNITRLDAVETVNQALGEFDDKLSAAALTPVFRQPENPVWINADGRLLWRVLSNLLTNAVKYAMPDTRMFVDLQQIDGQVLLSIKNVSRQELRQGADELMERFVQGDISRSAGGAGLGLNIARSLMEVQGGQMQLMVDGDLFKVTLIFPGECS